MTGTTPEDLVTVFTCELDTDKVDSTGAAVNGAGFTLYKYDYDADDYVEYKTKQKNTTGNAFTWTGLDVGDYKLEETPPYPTATPGRRIFCSL